MLATQMPLEWRQAFATRLKAAREVLGMSQRELAKRVGLTHECIGQWERAKTTPTTKALVRFVGVVDLHWLLTGSLCLSNVKQRSTALDRRLREEAMRSSQRPDRNEA